MAKHIEVEGLQSLLPKIKTLPETAKEEVIKDVSDYSLEIIKEEPPNKYITRKQAYGVTFFSPAQRGWFWTHIDPEKDLPYKRTGTLKNSWFTEYINDGVKFYNTMEGAEYVMGDKRSAHEKLVGWKTITEIMSKYLTFQNSKFRNTCMEAYQKAIRKLNLG